MKKGSRTRLLFVALAAVVAVLLITLVPRVVGHDADASRSGQSAQEGACPHDGDGGQQGDADQVGEEAGDASQGACQRNGAGQGGEVSLLLRARMGAVVNLCELSRGELRVALRGREPLVTEQFLDGAQVGSLFQQMRAKGVAERVRMHV